MAVPASFDESNDVLGRPVDMSDDDCAPLSIYRHVPDEGFPLMISCWKFTKEELDEINRTGRIWLTVYGVGHPPVHVSGIKPLQKG